MKQAHRKFHRLIWLFLLPGLLMLVLLITGNLPDTQPSNQTIPQLDGDKSATYQIRELP
jgi:hypothetical protein